MKSWAKSALSRQIRISWYVPKLRFEFCNWGFDFHSQIERLAKAEILYLVTEKVSKTDLHPDRVLRYVGATDEQIEGTSGTGALAGFDAGAWRNQLRRAIPYFAGGGAFSRCLERTDTSELIRLVALIDAMGRAS